MRKKVFTNDRDYERLLPGQHPKLRKLSKFIYKCDLCGTEGEKAYLWLVDRSCIVMTTPCPDCKGKNKCKSKCPAHLSNVEGYLQIKDIKDKN